MDLYRTGEDNVYTSLPSFDANIQRPTVLLDQGGSDDNDNDDDPQVNDSEPNTANDDDYMKLYEGVEWAEGYTPPTNENDEEQKSENNDTPHEKELEIETESVNSEPETEENKDEENTRRTRSTTNKEKNKKLVKALKRLEGT